MNEEKVYIFNNYVLGYDSGLEDVSCLTISQIKNDNLYVLATLYNESAILISSMLDNLQQENKELKDNWNELKEWLEEYIENIKMQYQNSEPTRQYSLQVIKDTLQVTIDKIQEIEKGGMNE